MRSQVLHIAVAVLCAVPALASVNLEATCSDGQAHITLIMANSYGTEGLGFVVSRSIVGLCEEPEIIISDRILLPPPTDDCTSPEILEFTVPAPIPNVVYRFEALFVDQSGAEVSPRYPSCNVTAAPRLVDHVSDGDAVVMRGKLSWGPSISNHMSVYIEPCAEGCWGPAGALYNLQELVPMDSPLAAEAFIRSVVDVVGLPSEPSGMADFAADFVFTEVRRVETGECGPVPNENTSWGALKATYR